MAQTTILSGMATTAPKDVLATKKKKVSIAVVPDKGIAGRVTVN